jgi:secreted trypsin-like serine protease
VSAAGCRCRFQHACAALLLGAAIGTAWGPAAAPASAFSQAARAPRASESIVGGAGASITSFPFQVALYDPTAGSPAAGFFCGGVIVDSTHVITAAHCLAGDGGHGRGGVGGEVEVLAGSTRLDRPEPGSIRDPAVAVSTDPSYDPQTNDYDIGVVTLAYPLWAGSVAPSINGVSAIAPLPIDPTAAAAADAAASGGEPGAGTTTYATISGWGDTNPAPSEPPSYPSALRSVSVPLVPEALCREEYVQIEQMITPRMLCAGSPHADSCYGDSGGPLLVDRDTPARPPEDYVLIGLVDFGEGCAQPGYAGVYTSIADPAIAHYLSSGMGQAARAAGHGPARRKHRRAKHRAHRFS